MSLRHRSMAWNLAFVGLLALTIMSLVMAGAAEELRLRMMNEAVARTAGPPDVRPDDFSVSFNVIWDEVDPGARIVSRAVEVAGLGTDVEASISGQGDPEISVGKRAFQKGPVSVGNGEKLRVRLRVPETLGEAHSATLTIGERSVSFTARSRQFGAFAFDLPDGEILEVMPAAGEILRVPVGLDGVLEPHLEVTDESSSMTGLDFRLDGDAISVTCLDKQICRGRHPVTFAISGREVRMTENNEHTLTEREIVASYVMDISPDVPLGFMSDMDLGTRPARKGVVTTIDFMAAGVQGVMIEMNSEDSRRSALRLDRSDGDRIDVICDDMAKCTGRHVFRARAESWNPRRIAERRFEIEIQPRKAIGPRKDIEQRFLSAPLSN